MNYIKYVLFVLFLLINITVLGQNVKQEKMEQLSFMVGEWIGISKSYENGVVSKEVPAYQKISYDLDENILVIELHSETLQLHTIIYYDEKDSTYYYYAFSKRGAGKYPAKYKDGQLIVESSKTKRFIFSRTSDSGFKEYGEELIQGKWTKYFEDTFSN